MLQRSLLSSHDLLSIQLCELHAIATNWRVDKAGVLDLESPDAQTLSHSVDLRTEHEGVMSTLAALKSQRDVLGHKIKTRKGMAQTNLDKARTFQCKREVYDIKIAELQGKSEELKKRKLDRINKREQQHLARAKRKRAALNDKHSTVLDSDSDDE